VIESDSAGAADVFQALARESTLTSRVVEQMEAMISDGRLREGSRLPAERDLARQFSVSRTVIREAVAALVAKELLLVEAGSGTTIRKPSLGAVSRSLSLHLASGGGLDLRKAAEARRLLLIDLAVLAAERHTDDDLERVTGILKEAEEERPIPASFVRWVTAFHGSLGKASGNEVLAALTAVLDEAMAAETLRACEDPVVTERLLRNLQSLLKPLRKRDAKGARQSMRDCLVEFEEALVLTAIRRPAR